MPKISHDTLKSSRDEKGNCHRICIDVFSSKRCKNLQIFTAQRYSYSENKYADPRHEKLCTAKFPSSCTGTKQWALQLMTNSESARQTAILFVQTFLQGSGQNLIFTFPQYATLESVSFFYKKNIGEYVVFEDTLPNFTLFIDRNGRVPQSCLKHNKERKSKKCKNWNPEDSAVTISDDSCSYDNLPSEIAIPAQEMNYLTPTCPPCEDDNPPSYEELYGNVSYNNNQLQTDFNHLNNNTTYFGLNLLVNDFQCCHIVSTSNTKYDPEVMCSEVGHTRSDTTNQTAQEEEDRYPHPVLRAYVHYDFYMANGQRVISNLKGTCSSGAKYTLTTPTFHSLTKTYAKGDMGKEGIKSAIKNHVCCQLCRHLPPMQEIFTTALTLQSQR